MSVVLVRLVTSLRARLKAAKRRAARYRAALVELLGVIQANRLILGDRMDPRYLAEVERRARAACDDFRPVKAVVERAREDADRKAKPKTRLLHHMPDYSSEKRTRSVVIGPADTYEAEDGTRVPLK